MQIWGDPGPVYANKLMHRDKEGDKGLHCSPPSHEITEGVTQPLPTGSPENGVGTRGREPTEQGAPFDLGSSQGLPYERHLEEEPM